MSTTASDRTTDPEILEVTGATRGPESLAPPSSRTLPVTDPGDRLYRFSVEQYQQLGRAGVLSGDDRVELIEGLVVKKMTKYERHISTTKKLMRQIERALPDGWHVGKEDPIQTARSEPEPDISVLRRDIDDYLDRKPVAADIALVVEVADSSYHDDRRKRAIYAEASIPISWIVNLNADRIEVYSEPTGPDPSPEYRSRRDYPIGEEIPLVIDAREVARLPVATLLAPTGPR
jgi:hypothetical protein